MHVALDRRFKHKDGIGGLRDSTCVRFVAARLKFWMLLLLHGCGCYRAVLLPSACVTGPGFITYKDIDAKRRRKRRIPLRCERR